ncbi:MAG: hypothetical protein FWC26_04365 [Fibromonadales bacterium]|nr:hypothetical protein [Fibromonadales bacterium]
MSYTRYCLAFLCLATIAFSQGSPDSVVKVEIDFAKILSKDTTIEGYESRIKIIETRKIQADEEIKTALEDFSKNYPPLEPQKKDETAEAFKLRHDAWHGGGMLKVAELRGRHELYKSKLDSSIGVLNDYILSAQSALSEDAYALSKAAAQDAVAGTASSGGSSGLGWRGWTRIASYTLSAGCIGATVYKHMRADKYRDKLAKIDDRLYGDGTPPKSKNQYDRLRKNYVNFAEIVENSEDQRLIYGISAGVFAIAGTLTFVF